MAATVRGVPGYDDLLPDLSLAQLNRERLICSRSIPLAALENVVDEWIAGGGGVNRP